MDPLEGFREKELSTVNLKLDQCLFVRLKYINDVQIGEVVSKMNWVEFWEGNKQFRNVDVIPVFGRFDNSKIVARQLNYFHDLSTELSEEHYFA